MVTRMGANARNKRKRQEAVSSRAQIIVFGLVVAIIGSVIAASYQKATLTNYAGFGMLLGGVSIFIFGFCATACDTVSRRCAELPLKKASKPRLLHLGIWVIGVGLVLAIVGSTFSSGYAKTSELNTVGFGMLLAGICCFVLGIFGALLGILQVNQNRTRRQTGFKIERPKFLTYSVLSIGVGLVLIIVGYIVAGSYAKQTTLNYTGFGALLSGVAVLTLGMSATAVTIVKSTLDAGERGGTEPGAIVGSIWAIGIGAMLLVMGSLIAGSYAKTTLMNYSGFGMVLSGTGVFVYGLFETARFSTMGVLSGKFANPWERHGERRSDTGSRMKSFWANAVRSTAMLNLAGVMVAMGLLFFSLWQLDLIVSGPVWYQNPGGSGWSWPGPGAYAKDYFQCFIWKTTVGQAYDTLFMLIFISFIVLFASAFFWPKSRGKTPDLARGSQRGNARNSRARQRRASTQAKQPLPPPPSTSPASETPEPAKTGA